MPLRWESKEPIQTWLGNVVGMWIISNKTKVGYANGYCLGITEPIPIFEESDIPKIKEDYWKEIKGKEEEAELDKELKKCVGLTATRTHKI